MPRTFAFTQDHTGVRLYNVPWHNRKRYKKVKPYSLSIWANLPDKYFSHAITARF